MYWSGCDIYLCPSSLMVQVMVIGHKRSPIPPKVRRFGRATVFLAPAAVPRVFAIQRFCLRVLSQTLKVMYNDKSRVGRVIDEWTTLSWN